MVVTVGSTHCAYPRRDGQAELAWVAGYVMRQFTCPKEITHPGTDRAQCIEQLRWSRPTRYRYTEQQRARALYKIIDGAASRMTDDQRTAGMTDHEHHIGRRFLRTRTDHRRQ